MGTVRRGVLVGGLLLVAGVMSAQDTEADVGREGPPVRRVRTATVTATPPHRTVRLRGVTRASERGVLSFPQGGRLVARSVQVGDRVERGDVLARVDRGPLNNGVRAAEATVVDLETRLAQVKRDRARIDQLAATASVADARVEQIHAQQASLDATLQAALAQLAEARRQRADGVLTAPFSGTVSRVLVEPGEVLAPGQPVVELSGAGIEVALDVPESVWAHVDEATPARVELPAIDCSVEGEVTHVGTSTGAALFPVLVGVDGCGAVSGLTATVDLSVLVPAGVSVPVRAVSDPTGSRTAVFRVRGDRVERVDVRAGRLLESRVRVDGELAIDDVVVVAGQVGLVDGQQVQVVP